MDLLKICVLISSVSFLGYTISYFISPHMKDEFKRFKLEKLGLLIIVLEFLGATGLLVGFLYEPILILSSFGLGALMLIGLVVRIRLKDNLKVSLPAFFYMALNFGIFYMVVR
jgi:hypothetical protein